MQATWDYVALLEQPLIHCCVRLARSKHQRSSKNTRGIAVEVERHHREILQKLGTTQFRTIHRHAWCHTHVQGSQKRRCRIVGKERVLAVSVCLWDTFIGFQRLHNAVPAPMDGTEREIAPMKPHARVTSHFIDKGAPFVLLKKEPQIILHSLDLSLPLLPLNTLTWWTRLGPRWVVRSPNQI